MPPIPIITKGFYYYFYDMKVQSLGCASAARKAVTLTKPVIVQSNNTLTPALQQATNGY
jgi:hypothetical protein